MIFSVLVPNGWQIYEESGYGHFVEDDTFIDMYALSFRERDVSIAIAKAIDQVFPNYTGQFAGIDAFPIGSDNWIVNYSTDGEKYHHWGGDL